MSGDCCDWNGRNVIKEKKEPSEKQNINQFISMTLYRYIFVPTDEKWCKHTLKGSIVVRYIRERSCLSKKFHINLTQCTLTLSPWKMYVPVVCFAWTQSTNVTSESDKFHSTYFLPGSAASFNILLCSLTYNPMTNVRKFWKLTCYLDETSPA